MITLIGLMIAVYGSGRLANDAFARHQGEGFFTVLTWMVSVVAATALWILAFVMLTQGSDTSNPFGI